MVRGDSDKIGVAAGGRALDERFGRLMGLVGLCYENGWICSIVSEYYRCDTGLGFNLALCMIRDLI